MDIEEGQFFHVSSVRNRESILAHGLNWVRMGPAKGIAGSTRPEVEGCFLARDAGEAQFFVNLNNSGDAVDVWQVADVDVTRLVDNGTGFDYLPEPIPAEHLMRVRLEREPVTVPGGTGAYVVRVAALLEDGGQSGSDR